MPVRLDRPGRQSGTAVLSDVLAAHTARSRRRAAAAARADRRRGHRRERPRRPHPVRRRTPTCRGGPLPDLLHPTADPGRTHLATGWRLRVRVVVPHAAVAAGPAVLTATTHQHRHRPPDPRRGEQRGSVGDFGEAQIRPGGEIPGMPRHRGTPSNSGRNFGSVRVSNRKHTWRGDQRQRKARR